LNFQVDIDFEKEPIGTGKDGNNVYLRDIWPSTQEIAEVNNVCFPDNVKLFYRFDSVYSKINLSLLDS